ncbi:hypothetical protein [Streptomyces sp. NPDC050263]|uniref:hypothetical protein n=1 Tax=Streptomyces sp. NPDC050263 TaxID=3155037 RepID=UPI0034217BF1
MMGELDGLLIVDPVIGATRLNWLSTGATGVGEVRLSDKSELIIPPLSAEDVPAEAASLREELSEPLPLAPIASPLVELDRCTGFLDCITHARRQTGPITGAQAQPAGGADRQRHESRAGTDRPRVRPRRSEALSPSATR